MASNTISEECSLGVPASEAYHDTPFIDIRFVDGDRLYLHYIHQVTSEVMMQFPREIESIPVDQDGKVEVAFSYEHPMG